LRFEISSFFLSISNCKCRPALWRRRFRCHGRSHQRSASDNRSTAFAGTTTFNSHLANLAITSLKKGAMIDLNLSRKRCGLGGFAFGFLGHEPQDLYCAIHATRMLNDKGRYHSLKSTARGRSCGSRLLAFVATLPLARRGCSKLPRSRLMASIGGSPSRVTPSG
jgi:hypothetical protein